MREAAFALPKRGATESKTIYTLKRSKRARALRITVQPDGAIVVVAPQLLGLAAIERFLLKHSDWVRRHVRKAKRRKVIRLPRRDIPKLKKAAHSLASERAAFFAARYGVSIGAISIRAQKSRWGSCSHKGNLSFNYKIAALSPELADYIVVHEVCHRLEMNHSRKFWTQVAREVSEYKELRNALREVVISFF